MPGVDGASGHFTRVVENPFGDQQLLQPSFQPQAANLEAFLGPAAPKRRYRLPAEFERQGGLLLACHEMIDTLPSLFVDIVASARPHVPVVLLVNDVEEWIQARDLLRHHAIADANVLFAEVPHDTMWARDYGPMIVFDDARQPAALNAHYESITRVDDDDVPINFGLQTRLSVVSLPLRIDGGNLLSNGRGLCLTTQVLFDENQIRGIEEPQTRELLDRYYGATQTLILEPLVGEPTGHVDMFAAFVSSNTVVVGEYNLVDDPVNCEVLDRNAARLNEMHTETGPLQVIRIPMPPHNDGVWRTFTNIAFANRAVLMPNYELKDGDGSREALQLLRSLMPDRRVIAIDAEAVAKLGGALHCVTMNLGPVGRLPQFPPPRRHRPLDAAVSVDDRVAGDITSRFALPD